MLLGLAVLAFVLAFAVLRLLLTRLARFALDQPNERSLHQTPVPRTGGIAVLAGTAAGFALVGASLWLPMLLALLLAAVSLYDDVRGLGHRARLAIHLAAGMLVVWYVLTPMQPIAMALLVVAVVWITNLYNFMDGADGVAGGMSVIGFGAYATAAWLAGHFALAGICAAIAASSLAFLLHNFHPARIFLGDVGSIPLGFLAAALGLIGWRYDVWPLWFPVLVFGPFNADATVTLVKRLLRRQPLWRAHREHYYQRIVRMGLGHRAAALIGYSMMLFCAAMALIGHAQRPAVQLAAFAGASTALAAVAVWVDVRWARFAGTT